MSVKKNDLFMGLYLLAAVIFFIISIPSWLLDIMLAINIGIALIILFNTLYAKEVLDMAAYPTMLESRLPASATILGGLPKPASRRHGQWRRRPASQGLTPSLHPS